MVVARVSVVRIKRNLVSFASLLLFLCIPYLVADDNRLVFSAHYERCDISKTLTNRLLTLFSAKPYSSAIGRVKKVCDSTMYRILPLTEFVPARRNSQTFSTHGFLVIGVAFISITA